MFGNPHLYETGKSKTEIKVLIDNDHGRRSVTIFDSILVFCSCGNLTIHNPYQTFMREGVVWIWEWKSRRMWKGWRKYIKLNWMDVITPKDQRESRSLNNVSQIDLNDQHGTNKQICFVNQDSIQEYRIHEKQLKTAEAIFISLLCSWTRRGFYRNIDNHIRDIGKASAEIAQSQLGSLSICSKVLPAAIEELSRLKDTIKSSRLKDLREALNKARIGARFPMLPFDDGGKGQPEIIKQLLEIRA